MTHLKHFVASLFVSSAIAAPAAADVTTRTVTLQNEGATLSGTLYLPDGHDGAELPTVLVTGAWTSVEEQMPATYARAMADRGFAAFTFDFRGWGKSGDLPGGVRFREAPSAKIDDIRAAIDALAKLPEVGAIHGLGICASAGYMVNAASGNPQIASVGLVAPWLQNEELVEAVYGGPEGVAALTALGRKAEAEGGVIIPAAGPEGAEGVLMPLGGYYYEPERGAVPAYDNKWDQASWEGWLTYHPADDGAAFDKPLAVIHSEAAAIPGGLRSFVQSVTGEATQRWLEDVTQFDFYDDPAAVAASADTMAAHFSGH